MDMTCHVCGYTANYLKFAYLCKNGCPACGESDMRLCPACGTKCVFSRAESLEGEELKMRELSVRLAGMVRSQDPQVMAEAKNLLETVARDQSALEYSGPAPILKGDGSTICFRNDGKEKTMKCAEC